jgi:protein involved in polysaccharide export with SLBB domain
MLELKVCHSNGLDLDEMRRFWILWPILGIAFQLSACSSGADRGVATEADLQAISSSATAPHKFQGGEKIKITVYNEPTLSGEYDIDTNGVVSLPLAGTVRAVGLTQSEFEQELAKKFKTEYLRSPKVTVTISQYRPIYIIGEAEKQGEFQYKNGLNVLTAIAMAGGGTYRANRNYVLIQHFGEVGMKEYPQSSATRVLPGDLIKVPERYF